MEQLTPFAALIGIDWSDAKHDICLVETATGTQELSVVKHTPESLNEWARALRSRFGGERIAVCLEQSRGSLIYALLKYDFLTLYPINPQMLSRFREAFTPSRAKDDPTDAEYLVELLIHHRERLKARLRNVSRDVQVTEGRLLDFETADAMQRALHATLRTLEELTITVAVMERRLS